MRNLNYRRVAERLHFKRRKKLVNSIKDWKLNDEQVKVHMESPVNWMSNEFWYVNKKKRTARLNRRKNKIELKNLFIE